MDTVILHHAEFVRQAFCEEDAFPVMVRGLLLLAPPRSSRSDSPAVRARQVGLSHRRHPAPVSPHSTADATDRRQTGPDNRPQSLRPDTGFPDTVRVAFALETLLKQCAAYALRFNAMGNHTRAQTFYDAA